MNRVLLHTLLSRNGLNGLWELLRLSVRRKLPAMSGYRPEIYYGQIDAGKRLEFRTAANPLVTIVVPVHNNWDLTYSCLYSVLLNTHGISYEVIVADDASGDETKNITGHIGGIKVVRNEENLGFLRTCNRASREARGEYLLFLNNDTNVQHGWLKGLLDLFENDDSVGVAGSKLVYPDGRLQDAGGIVWNDGNCWIYGRWDDPQKAKYNEAKEMDYVSGACILVRRQLWEEIEGFDERYSPAYYEDADLALEARRRGFKVMYGPGSVVVHFEGVTCGRDVKKGTKRYQEINREKFFAKWQEVLKRDYAAPGTIRPWRDGRKGGVNVG